MAYLRKTKGGWRAEVSCQGVRCSATRETKAAAQAWAVMQEAAILAGDVKRFPDVTLGDAVARYKRDVVAKKPEAAARADLIRFDAWVRDFPQLGAKILHKITAQDLAVWRDARLSQVAKATVTREVQLFRPIWTIARREWGWVGESPWPSLSLPKKAQPRRRVGHWQEMRRMLRVAGVSLRVGPESSTQQAAWAALVAMHTGLRSGEVLRMSCSTVNLDRRVFELQEHKTVAVVGVRRVPLTKRAARALRVLEAHAKARGRDAYFTVSDASRDVQYRKLCELAAVDGLRFHDLRATALTLLSRRVDVMTLARISGHKKINELFNTYYRETEEEIAARL